MTATTRYLLIIFICCLCCSADGSYEVKLLTKAIVYHSGDILWQPPAIYKGRITSGILLRDPHSSHPESHPIKKGKSKINVEALRGFLQGVQCLQSFL